MQLFASKQKTLPNSDHADTLQSPQHVKDEQNHDLVDFLIHRAERSSGKQRRREHRIPISVTLIAQILDDQLLPIGEPFRVLTTNVSRLGIGLVHSERIDCRFLNLRLPHAAQGETVCFQHCSPLGESGVLYLIGVERSRNSQDVAS